MSLTTAQKLLIGAGVALKAVLVARWMRRKRSSGGGSASSVSPSRIVCPEAFGRSPANLEGIGPGDYVAVTLTDASGLKRESTWAEVLSVGDKTLQVQIAGESEGGTPRALLTGFSVGDKLLVPRACVWDVLERSVPFLCGAEGARFARSSAHDGDVRVGDAVKIVIDSGGGFGPTWGEVIEISKTGSVIRVNPLGLRGSSVSLTRDCIYEVKR